MAGIGQWGLMLPAVLFGLLTIGCSSAGAETEAIEIPVLSKLASPKDENPSGTQINEHNLGEFEQLIPDELKPAIKAADISLTAFRSLRTAGDAFDDRWLAVSAERVATPDMLEQVIRDGFPRSFLFSSSIKVLDDATLSIRQQGEQLLWNAQSPVASRASYGADFTLAENGATQGFSLRGSVQRVVPRRFRAEDRTGQLFRERIRIESPAVLKGLSWLTFRFINEQEDVVWAHSPAIKKTRQITSTNRSDPFLGSPLAAEDLLGFAGKIQLLEGVRISRQLLVAPFFSLETLALKSEAACATFVPDRRRHAPAAASASEGKMTHAPSSIADMSFVPRELVRIDLLQRDPYSIYGRQVIYLDAENLAPYYKFVFNRTGQLEKIVITAHALVASADAKIKTIVPTSTFIRSNSDKRTATITYDRIRFCEEGDPTVTLTDFDPKGLGQGEGAAGDRKPANTSSASSSSSSE